MTKYIKRIFFGILAGLLFTIQTSALINNSDVLTIEFLDNKSVVFAKSKCVNINGIDYKIGMPQTLSFENSTEGRQYLEEHISEPLLSKILNFWNNVSVIASSKQRAKFSGLEKDAEITVNEVMLIDFLNNKNAVIVITQQINVDGVDYNIGNTWSARYENSEKDRKLIAEQIPEPFLSVVMAVWGDSPTVIVPEETELEQSFSK